MLRLMLAAFVPFLALACAPAWAEEETENKAPSTPRREVLKRNSAIGKVRTQLRRIKPARGKRKSIEDFFLVGTVQLTLQDRAANVKFEVMKGEQQSAEKLVDFVAGSPSQTARYFRVLARFGDEETAGKGVELARKRYDQLQAYRAELMKAYQASTICRT